jgi:hypothetical protein
MTINKEWHLKNKMPKNPSQKERMEWHIEHNKYCDCRKPTEKLLKEIEEYKKFRQI